MTDQATVHEVKGNAVVFLKVEDDRFVGRMGQDGPVVDEKDRFLIHEGATLGISVWPIEGHAPTKKACTLYLWQETGDQEVQDKDLQSAEKVEVWQEGEGPIHGLEAKTFFGGDLSVDAGLGGAVLTHVAGERPHAHYQFSLAYRLEWDQGLSAREWIWDPDVHDIKG